MKCSVIGAISARFPSWDSTDEAVTFSELGLESKDAAVLARDITRGLQGEIQILPIDVFLCPTVAELVRLILSKAEGGHDSVKEDQLPKESPDNCKFNPPHVAPQHLAYGSAAVMLIQGLGILSLGVIHALPAVASWAVLALVAEWIGWSRAIYVIPMLFWPYVLSWSVLVAVMRRNVAVVPPGSYLLWSWPYLKWWYGQLLLRPCCSTVVPLFEDTIFLIWWLRLQGAVVGDYVRISISDLSCPEYVTIGDETSLCGAVYCHEVWDGKLHIRPVAIGARCSTSGSSVVLPDAILEDGASLGPLSAIGCATLSRGNWLGSPPTRQTTNCH